MFRSLVRILVGFTILFILGSVLGCDAGMPGADADSTSDDCPDGGCDDGLFCNGSETCADGECQPGTSPCSSSEVCSEAADFCIRKRVEIESGHSVGTDGMVAGDLPGTIGVGTVIVGPGINGEGLLRIVTEVQQNGGDLQLETVQASIAEALAAEGEEGVTLTVRTKLFDAPDESQSRALEPRLADGGPCLIDLTGVVLASDPNYEIAITTGCIAFDPDIMLDVEFGFLEVRSARVTVQGMLTGDFVVRATASQSVEIVPDPVHIGPRDPFTGKPLPFVEARFQAAVGLLPVWGTVKLYLSAGIEATLSAEGYVEAGADATASLSLGADFDGHDWTPRVDSNLGFGFSGPDFDMHGHFYGKVYVLPRVEIWLYDVVGPWVEVEPFLDLSGEFDLCELTWQIGAGLEARIGGSVEILSYSLIDIGPFVLLSGDDTWQRLGEGTISAGECCSDDDCDDGDPCTEEQCIAYVCQYLPAGECCSNADCNYSNVCDDGVCVPGPDDCANNCNDGDLCTTDTCIDGECLFAPVCSEGQACDSGTGECVEIPSDCDNTPCDDDLFCNGFETCDANGDCQDGIDPCPGQGCNEVLDVCICDSDDDCDDGVFCTGVETCDQGECRSSGDPCKLPQVCDESGNLCRDDCVPPLVNVPDQTTPEGEPYTGVAPTLEEGTTVTWSLADAPAGMTIGPDTGVPSWSDPTAGTHGVTISAVNNCGSDSHTWQLTVTPIQCLTVSPTVLDFGTIPCGGSVSPKTVVLTNAKGCDPASGEAFITAPWINVSPTTYDLNSSDSQSFDIWPDTTLLDQDYSETVFFGGHGDGDPAVAVLAHGSCPPPCDDDYIECNGMSDTCATAYDSDWESSHPITRGHLGWFNPAGDVDWFVMRDVPGGSTIQVNAHAQGQWLDLSIALYAECGSAPLLTVDEKGTVGIEEELEYTVGNTGDYYLLVVEEQGRSGEDIEYAVDFDVE